MRVTPLKSAQDVVDRELSLLTLGVAILWMFIPATGWLDADAPSAAGIALVLLACALLASVELSGRIKYRPVARWLLLGAVAVVTVAQYVVTQTPGWAASMAILLVIVASALLPKSAALTVLAVTVTMSLGPVAQAILPYPRSAALGAFTLPAYLLLIGVGVLIVRFQLIRNARLVDENTQARDLLEGDRRVALAVEESLVAQERVLHETVLNTLTAVARGGLPTDSASAASTSQRLRQAAGILEVLAGPPAPLSTAADESTRSARHAPALDSRDLSVDLAQHLQRLRESGVTVTLTTDDMSGLPSDVIDACVTAAREALANVERHANASRVDVVARVGVSRHQQRSVQLRITDDGAGFDPLAVTGRFGTTAAIMGAMASVSGSGTVATAPGAGTCVTLEWRERCPDEIDQHRVAVGRIALSELAIGALFVAVTAAVAWTQFGHPSVAFLGLSLAVAFGALVILAAPEAPVSWGFVVVVSTIGPVVWVIDETDQGSLVDQWTLAAVIGLYLITAVLSPPWGWLLLLASTVILALSDLDDVIPAATVVLVGAAGGRALRRDSAAMVRAHDQAATARTRLDVTERSVARLRARYAPLTGTGVIEFVHLMADGTLDVAAPAVRQRAAHEERYIRSLMRTAPERSGLPALAGVLAHAAREHGADLEVDLRVPDAADVQVPSMVAASLEAAVAHMDPAEPARLVAHAGGDTVWLTLVASIPPDAHQAMASLPLPGAPADPSDPTDTTLMWETHLPRSQGEP